MLPAQVEYWKLQETKRHNYVTEDQGWFNLFEVKRHNLATEDIGWSEVNEKIRHNIQTEDISRGQLALGWSTLGETTKHNRASEAIGRTQATAAMEQAGAAWTNADTNRINADTNWYRAEADVWSTRETTKAQIDYWKQTGGATAQRAANDTERVGIEDYNAQTNRLNTENTNRHYWFSDWTGVVRGLSDLAGNVADMVGSAE